MTEAANETLWRLCRLLHQHAVEYLIVGGAAVAVYGYYRMSTLPSGELADKYDFDFWYNPTYANYYRLLDALAEMGIDVDAYRREPSPDPKKSFFRHSFEDFTLDFLPEIRGLGRFNESFRRKTVSALDGFEVYTVALADLILSKQSTNRAKDQEDIAALLSIHSSTDTNQEKANP